MHAEHIQLRLATHSDIPELVELIELSVRGLGSQDYQPQQLDQALGSVFGVDSQLIADGSYIIAECEGQIVGAGGWSQRKTLFGSDQLREGAADQYLDPAHDPAKIRAFFVHPDWARRGIGRRLLEASETAALRAGFRRAELMATLPGERLYRSCGYTAIERVEVPMAGGLTLPCVRMAKQLSTPTG